MNGQSVFRGDRLHEARKAAGWTLQELGERIGVTRAQINNLELGNSEPSMKALALICYELNISADWLIDLSDLSDARERKIYAPDVLPFMD